MTTEATGTEAPEPVAAAVPEPEAVGPVRRPRGRTALIMAVAVVLGVLGGAGTGYAVQSARRPTPLPPLSVAQPAYPALHNAPKLPADQDDQVKTDGDLTELLVPAPAGTKPSGGLDSTHVWLGLADFAETFENPGKAFQHLALNHFRRVAQADWSKGSESTAIHLVQYSQDGKTAAHTEVTDQESYGPEYTGGTAVDVPGTSDGQVFPGRKDLSHAGEASYYEGRAYAAHGDIAVEMFVNSAHPVSAQALLTLLQNQLERL